MGKTHEAFLCAAQEGKWSSNMEEMNLCRQADTVNELLARYGVKFGIYKNGTFREQLFPFDAIPRVI